MSSTTKLDAFQVIKTVYDDTTGSFTIVPAYMPTQVWASALPATATQTLTQVSVIEYNVMGITVSWTGLSIAGGTLTLEGSHNGVNWFNIGSPYTMTGTSGAQAFAYSSASDPFEYVQMVYAPGATTTGTISAWYVLKA